MAISPVVIVSPAKHGQHMGFISLSSSSSSALSHFCFLKRYTNFIQTLQKGQSSSITGQVGKRGNPQHFWLNCGFLSDTFERSQ